MRREIIFCVLGAAAGFGIATTLFWEPSTPPAAGPVPSAATPATLQLHHSPTPPAEPAATRIGIAHAAPDEPPPAAPAPQTPGDLIRNTLQSLPGMEPSQRDQVVKSLIAQLRTQGPAGLAALREFFKTGEDVTLRNHLGTVNGRITSAPTLRIALLDALGDWPGSIEASREIARTTSRPFEAAIAIRNLEVAAPGVYRAEAIRTMQELAEQTTDKQLLAEGAGYFFDVMRHLGAPELIPAAEKLVAAHPHSAYALVHALADFPDAVATPAIQRVFSSPSVAEQMAANPYTLRNLPYSQPEVVRQAAWLFTQSMTPKQQDRFLADFGSGRAYTLPPGLFIKGAGPTSSGAGTARSASTRTSDTAADLRGRLAFLAEIEPAATTPVLQQRIAEAREEITNRIENPEPEPQGGASTQTILIGNGVGDAVIKGFKIEDIRIQVDGR